MWGLWVWIPPGSQEWTSQGVHSFFVSISIGRNNHNRLFFKKEQHILPILHSTLYIIYSAENALFTAIRDQEKRFHPKKQNRTNALFHSSTRPRLFCHFFPIIREKHDEISNISFRDKGNFNHDGKMDCSKSQGINKKKRTAPSCCSLYKKEIKIPESPNQQQSNSAEVIKRASNLDFICGNLCSATVPDRHEPICSERFTLQRYDKFR